MWTNSGSSLLPSRLRQGEVGSVAGYSIYYHYQFRHGINSHGIFNKIEQITPTRKKWFVKKKGEIVKLPSISDQ